MASLASRAARALLLAGLVYGGCGGPAHQPAYRDPAYKHDPLRVVPFAIGPAPVAGPRGEMLDRALERTFADTPGIRFTSQPSGIRRRLNSDHDLLWSIDQMMAQNYPPEALVAGPNLQDILNGKQLEILRKVSGEATLFLLPLEIATVPAGGSTRAHSFYRVYDLQSGRLLLQSTVEIEVHEGGEAGDRNAIVDLLLRMQADLTQRLLS